MNRRRTISPSQDHESPDTAVEGADTPEADVATAEEVYEEQYWEEQPVRPRGTWIAPTLAALAAIGWTGFFAWVNQQAIMAGAAPSQWLDWIVQWSVPMVLLVAVYLLVMRNSRREANRFSDAARALSHESAQLEARLVAVNRELALARNFIEAQARDLESLGRIASERLSTHAEHLESLIRDNSAQVESIGHVSTSAVSNMEALRDQLPVLANSARDMNNQIAAAGNSARGQIDGLVSAFERLNTFGEAGEAHVSAINEQVGDTLRSFEEQLVELGDLARQRFEGLRAQSHEFRSELEKSEEHLTDSIASKSEALVRQLSEDSEALRQREANAVSAMRERLVALRVEGERIVSSLDDGQAAATSRWSQAVDALEERIKHVLEGVMALDESATNNARQRLVALNDEAQQVDERLNQAAEAFEADFARRREASQQRENEAIAELERRLAEFDQRIVERQQEHIAHVERLAERGEALAQRFAALDGDLQQLGSQAESASGNVAEAAELLANRLSQSRAVLEENGTFISRLTDDSVRLLEIIRSSADHSEGALSDAISNAETRLSAFGTTANELQELIRDAESRGSNLASQLETARESGGATLEQLRVLKTQLESVAADSDQLAERTSGELREAIELLTTASAKVLENLRDEQSGAVAALAEEISTASREQLASAMRENAVTVLAELEQAAGRADAAGRETVQLLRAEMAKVGDLAANLEQRVEDARRQAEEHNDSDFSRRMALITEALNSTSIDISKAFDNDVADTQWTHYLRGDRGIFTRHAVRLLDKHEARQISNFYQEDAEFREVVNRYIHDFEAMLRGVLSTRDGNAIAVTLLSSDMGKLYVALAQAIERLRD
ncbi:hypothetical protein [Aurantiacibacter gilvus]|uniref:ATPase n=1 Tax=Aurantiacibacter gilvus TaxID=3139141 RepID=A0ABU9ICN4_9SPHN